MKLLLLCRCVTITPYATPNTNSENRRSAPIMIAVCGGVGLWTGAAPEGIVARLGLIGGRGDLKSKSAMLRTEGSREIVVGVCASLSV